MSRCCRCRNRPGKHVAPDRRAGERGLQREREELVGIYNKAPRLPSHCLPRTPLPLPSAAHRRADMAPTSPRFRRAWAGRVPCREWSTPRENPAPSAGFLTACKVQPWGQMGKSSPWLVLTHSRATESSQPHGTFGVSPGTRGCQCVRWRLWQEPHGGVKRDSWV